MKAIFIPTSGFPNLDYINKELKDVQEIERELSIEQGYLLIVKNVTRADKLKHINEIVSE